MGLPSYFKNFLHCLLCFLSMLVLPMMHTLTTVQIEADKIEQEGEDKNYKVAVLFLRYFEK